MARKFLIYVNNNYAGIRTKIQMLCGRNKQRYDQDALQEAIVRCYTAIEKKGTMTDPSPYGMESYLIRSYFNFLREEARSCKNSRRDKNITSDNINTLYEQYYNSNNTSSAEKIKSDLFKDFSTLYIMTLVEENFDQEHFYLFKLKSLTNMTYKQVCEKSKCKGCRTKILAVKDWLKQNVTKEDITKTFYEIYGELC